MPRTLFALVAGAVLCAAGPALTTSAAPRHPTPQVAAFFWHQSENDEAALAGFREGLKIARLDWQVSVHQAGGDPKRAVQQLNAVADAHPAVVLALGTRATLLAQKHIPGRPIVFTAVTNPVVSGVVPSWKGSGGNSAGNSNWLPARQLLKSFLLAVHGMRTLGVIRDPANPVSKAEVLEMQRAIETEYRGITLIVKDVAKPDAVAGAAAQLRDAGADAVWIPIDHLVYRNLEAAQKLLDAAAIPIVTSAATTARSAAVVGVVPDYRVLGLQAADLARRIVEEGAEPGAIPVGRLRTFRTVVNLKAAARCKYRVPLAVLAIADEVIQ